MKKTVTRGTAAALCCITAVTSFSVAYICFQRRFDSMMPNYRRNESIYNKLSEIRATVDKYYVGTYDLADAIDIAAVGFMTGVGDRWSSYMSAKDLAENQMSFSGKTFGVGLYVSYSQNRGLMRIVEVYPQSDAFAAGLEKGDVILGAGGKTIADDGYDAVMSAIEGEEGTKVDVTVRRSESDKEETVAMTRKTMDQVQVTGWMLSDQKTGFIRIYNFRQHSEAQLQNAIDTLLEQGASRLVFDVRHNPGGAVESVCKSLDPLLPEGTIMTLRTKAGKETVYHSDARALDMPMAVLADQTSVSAAEFFAAALQEYGKAVVVGGQTIGKGYSQQNYPLSDGSAIHLSDQEYFTPKGKSLIGTGVEPDISAVLPDDKQSDFYFLTELEDVSLQAALAALNAEQ